MRDAPPNQDVRVVPSTLARNPSAYKGLQTDIFFAPTGV